MASCLGSNVGRLSATSGRCRWWPTSNDMAWLHVSCSQGLAIWRTSEGPVFTGFWVTHCWWVSRFGKIVNNPSETKMVAWHNSCHTSHSSPLNNRDMVVLFWAHFHAFFLYICLRKISAPNPLKLNPLEQRFWVATPRGVAKRCKGGRKGVPAPFQI